jgi:hypothetical protein
MYTSQGNVQDNVQGSVWNPRLRYRLFRENADPVSFFGLPTRWPETEFAAVLDELARNYRENLPALFDLVKCHPKMLCHAAAVSG